MIITYRVQFIEKKEHSQEIEKAEKVSRLISFHYTGKSDTHDAAFLVQADIFSVNTGEYDEMQCFFPRKTPLQIFDRVLNTPRFNTALKYLYLCCFSPVSAILTVHLQMKEKFWFIFFGKNCISEMVPLTLLNDFMPLNALEVDM